MQMKVKSVVLVQEDVLTVFVRLAVSMISTRVSYEREHFLNRTHAFCEERQDQYLTLSLK